MGRLVFLSHLKIRNFRCFDQLSIDFQAPFVVIQGNNGVGKTSIIEALHYACYLRSFRTSSLPDLLLHGTDHASIQVDVVPAADQPFQTIHIGIAQEQAENNQKNPHAKKLVKINQQAVKTYKDILDMYRVLSVTEDDLELIKGDPESRRLFINQALALHDTHNITLLRLYKKVLLQRNAVIEKAGQSRSLSSELQQELELWSRELWQKTVELQEAREGHMARVLEKVNELLARHFVTERLTVASAYVPKNRPVGIDFEQFWYQHKMRLISSEIAMQRSLYGAHLDDIAIQFQGKNARQFASRGQQKLVIFLMKLAQHRLEDALTTQGILLLDDFITDFDKKRLATCIEILENTALQIVVTSPVNTTEIFGEKKNIQYINL